MQRVVSAVLADFKEDDRMELRTLRYFLAVADEKNITRAAELLHVTQPTLSRQLSDLEDELGTTLMIRGKRSLTLTDDGVLFKQRAEDIVEMAERTEQEFKGRKSTISGTVSLGTTEAVSTHELVKFMRIFSEKYPDVRFHMYNAMADTLKEGIDQGTLDLALVLEPVDTARYEFIRMSKKERWGILVNKDHPLAGQECVQPEEIMDQPLILPCRVSSRKEILNWLGCEEHRLKIVADYNLLSNTVLLVEENMGLAVCLDGALAIHHSPDLRFIPLEPERSLRGVLIWKKNHVFNSATSLFIQMIYRKELQVRPNAAFTRGLQEWKEGKEQGK